MTDLTASHSLRGSLADALLSRRSALTDTALILGGVLITAVFAQISIPLWPVPVTGQTLAVLLVGATLGARRGALSMLTYAALGLAGLPIFANFTGGPAAVLMPSFGFVIGFIVAAALIGWLSERAWDRKALRSLIGFLCASIVPFLIGVPYMGVVLAAMGLPADPATLIALGVTPFIVGGVVKWLIAASLLPLAWKLARRR